MIRLNSLSNQSGAEQLELPLLVHFELRSASAFSRLQGGLRSLLQPERRRHGLSGRFRFRPQLETLDGRRKIEPLKIEPNLPASVEPARLCGDHP